MIIIGASGFVGQNLYEYFSMKGKKVIGTYHNNPKKGLQYFSLENSDLTELNANQDETQYILICSAINNLMRCKNDREKVYETNVRGTRRIIEQCFELDMIPVFFSSDSVFDGAKGNYNELDETHPLTVYGEHKEIIENFLLSSKKPYLIARLTKVFGLVLGDESFMTSWVEQLQENKSLLCATDKILSPVYVRDISEVLDLALERNLEGLYNINSPESFSRFQLATTIKSQLGIESGEIKSCSIKDFDIFESLPPGVFNASLNPEKIMRETGFKFSKMQDCLSKLEKLVY